jgi:hypothetical protein
VVVTAVVWAVVATAFVAAAEFVAVAEVVEA